jgi:proline iminopeptidase
MAGTATTTDARARVAPRSRAPARRRWHAALDAPTKDRTVLGTSGHRPLFEQPDEFVSYLTDVMLPGTAPGS